MSIDQQIQKVEARQEQNRNLLARLKARKAQAERKADTRRKILVGAVVLTKARQDPQFAAQLIQWLNEGLKAPRDRALFPPLCSDAQPTEPCPKNLLADKPSPSDGDSTNPSNRYFTYVRNYNGSLL